MNFWKQAKRVEAFKKCFGSEEGKIVLAELVKECGMLRNSFRGNTDELLFNEGKRNVLLYILAIINVDLPSLLDNLEKERQSQGVNDE